MRLWVMTSYSFKLLRQFICEFSNTWVEHERCTANITPRLFFCLEYKPLGMINYVFNPIKSWWTSRESWSYPSIHLSCTKSWHKTLLVHNGFRFRLKEDSYFNTLRIPLCWLLRRFTRPLGFGLNWGRGDVSFLYEVVAQIWLDKLRSFRGCWETFIKYLFLINHLFHAFFGLWGVFLASNSLHNLYTIVQWKENKFAMLKLVINRKYTCAWEIRI